MNRKYFNLTAIIACLFINTQAQQALRLKVMSVLDTTLQSEFLILHDANATDGYDLTYDAASMAPGDLDNYPWIYSYVAPNYNLVINSTGALVNDKIIPFQLFLGAATGMMVAPSTDVNLKFRAKNQNTYPGSSLVQFVDSGTTPVTVVNLQQAYNLVYNFAANTLYNNRFYLVITAPAKAKIKSCTEFSTIEINNPSSHPVSYSVTQNSTGNIVSSGTNFTGSTDVTQLSFGDYLVNITNEIGMISSQTIHVDTVAFSASIANNDSLLDLSSPTLQFNTPNVSATNGTNYLWNFGDGTTSTLAAPSHTFPGIGSYDVVLKTISTLGCIIYDTISVEVVDFTALSNLSTSKNDFMFLDKTIQFKGEELPTVLTIYSIEGKLVETMQQVQRTTVMPVLHTGVYIAKAQYNSSTVAHKLIVK